MFLTRTLQISSVPHDVSLFMLSDNFWRSIKAMAKEDAFCGERSFHGNVQYERPDSTESPESKSSLFFSKFYSHSIFHPV